MLISKRSCISLMLVLSMLFAVFALPAYSTKTKTHKENKATLTLNIDGKKYPLDLHSVEYKNDMYKILLSGDEVGKEFSKEKPLVKIQVKVGKKILNYSFSGIEYIGTSDGTAETLFMFVFTTKKMPSEVIISNTTGKGAGKKQVEYRFDAKSAKSLGKTTK